MLKEYHDNVSLELRVFFTPKLPSQDALISNSSAPPPVPSSPRRGFHVTAAIDCGNGQERCGYTEGEGDFRERCEFNKWVKKECCGRCDTVDQANSDILCNKPHGFTDGKCPLIPLGAGCQYRQECSSPVGKGQAFCTRGTCQIGQGTTGDPCEPGVTRCQTDLHVCSTTEKKCLYAFRKECMSVKALNVYQRWIVQEAPV